jgi:Helix-turn-helix domain
MAMADSVAANDGRLCAQLAARLDPHLQDALDHPIRRELLRTLSRRAGACSLVELGGELRELHRGKLGYHLQVLLQSGTVASLSAGESTKSGRAQFALAIDGGGQMRAVLRATEQWDRQRREAAAAANASPLLTMFRIPRPVRTLRLRGRSKVDAEQDR